MPELHLTNHAIERYRQRIDDRATEADIQALLNSGRHQTTAPAWCMVTTVAPGGYVVTNNCVFILTTNCGRLLATTCVRRRRRPKSKAVIRGLREVRREMEMVA